MKRLIVCSAVLAFVLIVASQCDGRRHDGTAQQADTKAGSPTTALDVAGDFLRALLSGQTRAAARVSTPLMAAQLVTRKPTSAASPGPAPTIELVILAADGQNADIAAELHWPGNRLAALRLRLVRLAEGWRVGEVQP